MPFFAEEAFDQNMASLQLVRKVAATHEVTPGQVALAWLLAKGDDVVPIPGTKRRTFLEENVGAAGVSLTAAEVADLGAVLPDGKAAGDRYAPELARFIDR